MAIIELHNQDIEIEKTTILKNVNLKIEKGEFVLLSGVSGSGKTTFINYLVENYPHQAARVFQEADQQFTMETPFLELVFLFENLCLPEKEIEKKVKSTLKEFHLEDQSKQPVSTLSGGEQQRLALAEAASLNSDLIILDEPFASVDSDNIKFLLSKVKDLQNKGRTIIVADHDPLIYKDMAERIFLFQDYGVKDLAKNKFDDFFKSFDFKYDFKLERKDLNDHQNILESKKLSVAFGQKNILKNIDANLKKGQNLLLVGENGSGKSTFLKTIVGLQKYRGKIIKNGRVILAFQKASDTFLRITVQDEIDLSLKNRFSESFDRQKIDHWLRELHLDKRKDSSVYSLSGGEKKKLQILLIVIQAPQIILLDEAFAGLDQKSVLKMISLLKESSAAKIFVSHQLYALDGIIDSAYKIQNKGLLKLEKLS